MHQAGFTASHFGVIFNLANDARRLLRLGRLLWMAHQNGAPIRRLIPDSDAKALKIGMKRDWERVRRTWERHDAIRRGEVPDTLTEFEKQDSSVVDLYLEENASLRQNWVHFMRIQEMTGMLIPTGKQLYDGKHSRALWRDGLLPTQMRAIAFPTQEEAHIAFHVALMGSGWNPATLISGIDATLPERIFQHPKDPKQRVLVVDAQEEEAQQDETHDIEVTMQGSKRRAGGRLQFCVGLKKNPDSPPNIVAAFLDRSKVLRERLRLDVGDAHAELVRLKTESASQEAIERQFKLLQSLQQGYRNVWLFVGMKGEISWIDGKKWRAFGTPGNTKAKRTESYVDRLISRLNATRMVRGEPILTRVVPGDLRDIFARWVHLQTGGNIIAVMFALGHAGLRSTNAYVDNNIFSAENDEQVFRFMTHLFEELSQGRVDLTILAQLVRHGSLTPEMQERLTEYRNLMRSRIMTGCVDPKHPPANIEPEHTEGKWCGTHRCLRDCPHARFLPDSLGGIAMRVEELMVMSEQMPFDTWMRGEFASELASGEYLLADLYPSVEVAMARVHWHDKIRAGNHVVPGVGLIREQADA